MHAPALRRAQVAELVDAPASGAGARKGVEVRVLFRAPSYARAARVGCLRSLGEGRQRVRRARLTPRCSSNDQRRTSIPRRSTCAGDCACVRRRGRPSRGRSRSMLPSTLRSRRITQNTPDLGCRRFSDVASAARSQGGVWELCSEPNYGGTCVTADTDLVLGAAGVDNTIASVRLVQP